MARWRILLVLLTVAALAVAASYVALSSWALRLELRGGETEAAWEGVRGGAARLGGLASSTFSAARAAALNGDRLALLRSRSEAERQGRDLLSALRDDARQAAAGPLAPGVEGVESAWRRWSSTLAALSSSVTSPPATFGAQETGLAVAALDRAYSELEGALQRLQLDAAVQRRQGQAARAAALGRLGAGRISLALLSILLAAGFGLLTWALGRRWDETGRKAEEITDQLKAAQEQADRSDFDSRELFTTSNDLLFAVDPDGHFRIANPRWRTALGMPPEELHNLRFQDYLRHDHRAVWDQLLAAARRRERVPRFEAALVATDGREVLVEGACWPRYEEDQLVELRGVMLDVTRQHSAEAALRDSEEGYRELFESSRDLIQVVNAEGWIEYVNPHWSRTLGYSADEVRNLHFTDVVLPSEVEHCQEAFAELREGKDQPDVETVFVAKDGRKVFVEGSVSASLKNGQFVACRGLFHDVTQRRLLEAERQLYLDRIQRQNLDLELRNREVERANRLKSEFLATMSHELRTPLTAIIGFSDLLDEDEETPLDPKHKTYLGFVRKGARHLLQLINDVLDLSKIEAGRLEINPEDLSLADAVAEVLSTIGPLATSKGIELQSEILGAGRVFADHVRLRQIFLNLLSNAVKFTPEGGQVSLSAATLGSLVCISVSDTGLGIPAEQQDAIFNEFHQVGTSAKGLKEGTGLGLAIVRRLVEIHRGRIWVDSEPGRGSVFTFLLPADRSAMESSSALLDRASIALREHPRRERPLVLVVDDDPAACELLISHLRSDGYDTATALSATEAMTKARTLRPDLVTLDLALGGGQGWRILQDLKRQRRTAALPVLVVSVIDEKRKGFTLGADDYLVKPADKAQLLACVRRHARPEGLRPDAVLVLDVDPGDSTGDGSGSGKATGPWSGLGLSGAVLAAGFRPLLARDGKEALRILSAVRPGAVVVNLLLPDLDGFQTILRLRAHPDLSDLPVVALAPEDLSLYNMDLLTTGPTRVLFLGEALWKEHLAQELARILGPPGAAAPVLE
jgi:PAS domain S-box-containing protein